ncbi:MAG: hypothetical protein LBS36_12850 [Oscillospiraceae bacterium]|nr:hypothetical protein [Oscillospiraceae bacterium]
MRKFLALVCAFLFLLPVLSACGKLTEGDGTGGEGESTTLEQGPEVDLDGESPVALLDRGATPLVEVGPFKISAEFIKTYLKWYIIHNGATITERAAAYEIAALYYAERGLAGTDQALTKETVQALLDEQEADFAANKEDNEFYCEKLGLTKQEFMDFAAIGEVQSLLNARFSGKIYAMMEQSYQSKHNGEGSAADISAYYPEYLQIFVRRLEFKELDANGLESIRKDIEAWVDSKIEG